MQISTLTLTFAMLACSTLAFGQTYPVNFFYPSPNPAVTDAYQIGYAANLNIGDSVLNLSNTGVNGANEVGNLCVNVFVMDAQEEQIACCSCLVTPDGLNSFSVKNDLIANTLTAAVPTSVVIKLISSCPALDTKGNATICNASQLLTLTPVAFATAQTSVDLGAGMRAWGTTLEFNSSLGNYSLVNVPYLPSALSQSELTTLTRTCGFIQQVGSGYGVCKSTCGTGALWGAKQN
jgi:hypothetical protein